MSPPLILNSIPGMAYRALNDGQWSIEYLSDGCLDILGLTADQLQQQGKTRLSDILVHSKNRQLEHAGLMQEDGASFQFEYVLQTPTGAERPVIERGIRVFDDRGMLVAIEGYVTEVAVQSGDVPATARQPQLDALQGLPRRQDFSAFVQTAIERLDLKSDAHTILLIELDQSGALDQSDRQSLDNDLLRQVLTCLRSRLRSTDYLAWMDGDVFGILLENCNQSQANRVAKTLCDSIEQQKLMDQQGRYALTLGIGVASTSAKLDTFDKLFAAAEITPYSARDRGRNRAHIYFRQEVQSLQGEQKLHWALEIPSALADERFYLEQQIIDSVCATGTAKIWYEILPRMLDVDGNTVMPDVFMRAAEEFKMATIIDIWMIETLLKQFSRKPDQVDRLGLCFINLSSQSIADPDFPERLSLLLQGSLLPTDRLCFGLTVGSVVASREQAQRIVQHLRQMGCRVALDDFGGDLASFGLAQDFVFDFIKINDAYIDDIENNPMDRSIVASIKKLRHNNAIKVIAKSVQTVEALEQLRKIGIDYAQGHAIARPGPLQAGLPQNMERVS